MRRRRPRTKGRWLQRLYKMRLKTALVVCLPIFAGVAWYATSAFARYERYRRLSDDAVPLNVELYQIFLHDELDRNLRALSLDEPPADSRLDLFEVVIDPKGTAVLEDDAERKGKRRYVKTFVRRNGTVHAAQIRHQGRRHWHGGGAQKSMKVRAAKGDLIDGVRMFNLINDVTPFGLEEQIVLGLARDGGLLTPEYRPVRLRLNNTDMGVYRLEAQPDEGLLRRGGRMPGGLYSGTFQHCDTKTPTTPTKPCGWRKVSWRTEETKLEFGILLALLGAVFDRSHADMATFAREHIDLDRFAFFDALDVVFGGEQHDASSNHKLYFDPYRGRFEPIARDFRAFTHDPRVNLVENPLQLRLKALPDYVWRRDAHVYQLVTGAASVASIRKRVDTAFATLLPELRADPHWDAYKLLPRVTRFHRQMVRPMTVGRWLIASQSELSTQARRNRFLLDVLEAPSLTLSGHGDGAGQIIDAVVSGYGAHQLRRVSVVGDLQSSFTMYADTDLDGAWTDADPVVARGGANEQTELRARSRLLPAVRNIDGGRQTERDPRRYRYFMRWSGPAPRGAWLEVANLVTGGTSRQFVAFGPTTTKTSTLTVAQFKPAAGDVSPHPWTFPAKPGRRVTRLGPGVVELSKSLTFGPRETVRIAAGTQLVLGPGVSLTFRGPVHADGSIGAPIHVTGRADGAPFGGILITGPATSGSRLRHINIDNGSHPTVPFVFTPGVLNIYDTSDILVEVLSIRNLRATEGAEDALHATYVDNLRLHEVTVEDAPGDAVDIEHSTSTIRGLTVAGSADECLDLMTSKVRINDSSLRDCRGNAISAGERTHATMHGSTISHAKVGVLAKNASTVRVGRSLIQDTRHALRTNRRDVHYDKPSLIDAQDIYVVNCDKVTRRAKGTQINTHQVHFRFPEPGRVPTAGAP